MLSTNIDRRISEIKANTQQTKKKIGRRLTILTIVLPIAFFVPFYIPELIESISVYAFSYYEMLLYTPFDILRLIYAALAIVFLIEAIFFANSLNKPQFLTIHLNNESHDTGRESSADKQPLSWLTLVENFVGAPRMRLYVFIAVYLVLVVWFVQAQVTIYLIYGSFGDPLFATLILTFMLSILACFLLGYRAFVETKHSEVSQHEPLFHSWINECVTVLPKKVFVGESHNILAEFIHSERSDNKPLKNDSATAGYKSLEVELKAAGVTVDGEKKWKLSEASPIPTCLWNCHFQNAGRQTVNLVLRAIHPDDQKDVIFRHRFDISVNSAFSASLQPLITILILISTVIAVLNGLHLYG